MSNKTSVELFAIALYEGGYLQGDGDEIQKLLEQYLEMEKEQIEEAYKYARAHWSREDGNAERYYEQTYGGNK
jgi:hypothetical protein